MSHARHGFFTPDVVNVPGSISSAIRHFRNTLRDLARRPLRLEKEEQLDSIQRRDEDHQATLLTTHDWLSEPFPELQPSYGEVAKKYSLQDMAIRDPTTLIIVDEADRLRMASLEQVRAIFDVAEFGVLLIGMPGLEKRLVRYPQFIPGSVSYMSFIHWVRRRFANCWRQRWTPPGVQLPMPFDQETTAAIIRITGGNFRLLNRLLTQMERILEVNSLQEVDKAVVEAARERTQTGSLSE